jgi:hypothetical protein
VLDYLVQNSCWTIFSVGFKSPFYCRYNAGFSMCTNKIISFGLFLANLVGFFCRIMSTGSPQRRVRQKTEGDRAALRAKIMDRPVIAERNVVRSDIMVALWIVSTILSILIIGGIYILVPTLCTLGLLG